MQPFCLLCLKQGLDLAAEKFPATLTLFHEMTRAAAGHFAIFDNARRFIHDFSPVHKACVRGVTQ